MHVTAPTLHTQSSLSTPVWCSKFTKLQFDAEHSTTDTYHCVKANLLPAFYSFSCILSKLMKPSTVIVEEYVTLAEMLGV
jgi:hypothetical protein